MLEINLIVNQIMCPLPPLVPLYSTYKQACILLECSEISVHRVLEQNQTLAIDMNDIIKPVFRIAKAS